MRKKPTILVIEDESLVAKDIQNMLVTMGFNVPHVLFSGENAMQNIEAAPPDLILMDIGLKGAFDGISTSERIRGKYDIPIIYLTAYSDEKTIERAQKTEPYGYILKPFETSELQTVIDMALKRHKMEVALRANENLLKCTLESTIDGILVVDEKGKVSHANSRFAEMWRIPEDLIKTEDDNTLLNFVLDQLDYPEVFLNKVLQLYQSNEESYDTLTFKDGRIFERYSRPLLQGTRNVGRIWSFRNVTGTGQLERSEWRFFHDIVESCPDPIVILQDNKHEFVNGAFLRLFGYARGELSNGISFIDIIKGNDRESFLWRRKCQCGEKDVQPTYCIDLLARDGTIIQCENSEVAIDYNGGQAYLIVIRDIRKRKMV